MGKHRGPRQPLGWNATSTTKLIMAQRAYFFGALGVLAATEIVEWPIALVLATGQVLAENQRNRVIQELGEALEDA